jgi:hypothetical protein
MASFAFDWHFLFGIASGVLSVASLVPYIRDVLRGGDTKPNAVSFFLWTVLEVIALIAQIQAGASWSIIILIGVTFNTTLVTILALIGYGYKEYGKTEVICVIFAVLAIVIWQVTGEPVLAILLSILADAFASIPTLVKTYKYPESEHAFSWFLITLGGICGILATNIFNTANLAYPIYSLLMYGAIFAFAYFGRKLERE